MNLQIRNAEPCDQDTIAEFNRRLASETEGKPLDWEMISEGVRKVLADPHKGRYFVAELDGRIVGTTMITYEWSDWRNSWIWWLQSVYVHPESRGHGVFTRLYRHIEALAADSGVRTVRLYVLDRNARARATYARLGMKATGYQVLEAGDGSGD